MTTRSLRLFTLLAVLAGTAAPGALAQPRPLQVLADGSEIAFTTRQLGVPVEGRFTRFEARIALDPRRPETGSVGFTIDTGSARFGSPELDAEVPKPTWLDVARFPRARFRSTAIRSTGVGRFAVSGKLEIKGQAQDVVVPVQIAPAEGPGQASTASGSFTIRRLAFKVGEGEWTDTSMLADEVQVHFKLALAGLAPP